MPKRKTGPKDENDFLELAEEYETSGRKHSAGDYQKAWRFFRRAIDTYDAGIRLDPKSFDLAYSKDPSRALLEFNMMQQPYAPLMLREINSTELEAWRDVLRSCRHMQSIDADNTDVIFNTAQVLTALAEKLNESKTINDKNEASQFLQEAAELFSACLARQEVEFNEHMEGIAEAEVMQEQEGGVPIEQPSPAQNGRNRYESPSASSTSSDNRQWTTVIEAVTPHDIVETALAQISTYTTLVDSLAPTDESTLSIWTARSASVVENWIARYLPRVSDIQQDSDEDLPLPPTLSISGALGPPPAKKRSPLATLAEETFITLATFHSTLADASYRSSLINVADYATRLKSAWDLELKLNELIVPPPSAGDILSAKADNLIDFATTVSDSPNADATDAKACWEALSTALTLFSNAFKDPHNPNSTKATICIARGDAELRRFRLSKLTWASPSIAKSGGTLINNAIIYYRGAVNLLKQSQYGAVSTPEACLKLAIAEAMSGEHEGKVSDIQTLRQHLMQTPTAVRLEEWKTVMEEVLEEGLLDRNSAEQFFAKVFTS